MPLLEADGSGDLMPISGTGADMWLELDANEDLMPRLAAPTISASGAQAQFISDLYDEILGSDALVAKVTGDPRDHVVVGRYVWGSTTEDDTIGDGPMHYIEPLAYTKEPRTMDHNKCRLEVAVDIHEEYDQSASDDLSTAMNYIETLSKELMSDSDGALSSWISYGTGLKIKVQGPEPVLGVRDRLHTVIICSCEWAELV